MEGEGVLEGLPVTKYKVKSTLEGGMASLISTEWLALFISTNKEGKLRGSCCGSPEFPDSDNSRIDLRGKKNIKPAMPPAAI